MARKIIFAICLLAAIIAGGYFGFQTIYHYQNNIAQNSSVNIVEAERSILFLPQYIALSERFFLEQKLEVHLTTAEGINANAPAKAEDQQIQLGSLSQALLTKPLGSGLDQVAFAGLAQHDGTFLLARRSKSVFQWKDFKQRSIISGAPEDLPTIDLEEALKQHGLSIQQQVIIIHNLPSYLREAAFEAGVGDYLQCQEPLASLAESRGIGKIICAVGAGSGQIPAAVYTASPAYLKEHPEVAQKIANGICLAQQWLFQHSPEEIADTVSVYFPNLERAMLIKAIIRYKAQNIWSATPVITAEAYNRLKDYIQRAGELTNPIPYDQGINNRFAEKAAAEMHYRPPQAADTLKKE